ncbi:MAG TPA: hypothetical protein VFF67_05990 [Thermoplasmata archaeon]|nr:hypothetical protein [Thermoplasmata archaeon]
MNRTITFLGLAVLLGGIGLVIYPLVTSGSEALDIEVESGIFVLPVALSVLLWGASAPDPRVTTVRGVFGNPDENLLQRRLDRNPALAAARYRPSPKEPVNCRSCYTLIAPELADCPRCGRRRECRGCGKPLFFLAGAVRCAPCLHDEVYCDCPKVRRTPPAGRGSAR